MPRQPRPRPGLRPTIVLLSLLTAMSMTACQSLPFGNGEPPAPITPAGGSTLPSAECAALPDKLRGYFADIDGISSIDIETDDGFCAGEGSYAIIIEADPRPTAAAITATWDAAATAWDELGLADVASAYPRLSVHYGESWIETSACVVRLNQRQAAAIAGLVSGPWRTVFRADFAGQENYSDVHRDRQVLRLWLTEEPGLGLAPIADSFNDMWVAAAEAAAAAGWYRGEIGLSTQSAGNMTLPVPPEAPLPDGLPEAFIEGYDLSSTRGSTTIAPDHQSLDVRITVILSYDQSELDAASRAEVDALAATLEQLGYRVHLSIGHLYE